MSALTPSPSHKRIRAMEEREGDGEISDEYENAGVHLTRGALDKMRTVVEESACRKRKRALASDVQSKLMKVEAGLLNEEELLIEEEVGFDDEEISENKEESMSARAVDVLDEQGTVEKEDQGMPKTMVDRKEEVVDEKRQKLPDDEEQSSFEEEEILEEEEDEMLAYLWPGSGRKSVV